MPARRSVPSRTVLWAEAIWPRPWSPWLRLSWVSRRTPFCCVMSASSSRMRASRSRRTSSRLTTLSVSRFSVCSLSMRRWTSFFHSSSCWMRLRISSNSSSSLVSTSIRRMRLPTTFCCESRARSSRPSSRRATMSAMCFSMRASLDSRRALRSLAACSGSFSSRMSARRLNLCSSSFIISRTPSWRMPSGDPAGCSGSSVVSAAGSAVGSSAGSAAGAAAAPKANGARTATASIRSGTRFMACLPTSRHPRKSSGRGAGTPGWSAR